VSGAARTADAAIAVVATIAALIAVIIQVRRSGGPDIIFVRPGALGGRIPQGHVPFPSLAILLASALTTAPLAFRRVYPIAAFCVILGAVIATGRDTTSITFAAAIFAAYSAVAYSRFRSLALLSVLAGAVVVTAAYPETTPPLPARFTAVLVLLPTVAVGIATRVWRGRARESAERLRRAEAGHEAETRRAVEVERARIASEMHDVVTHNVSVMVVQAGAARRVLDSSPGDAREALLAVEASGRNAMTELRHLLGLLAPPGGVEPGPAADAAAAGGTVPVGAAGAGGTVPAGAGGTVPAGAAAAGGTVLAAVPAGPDGAGDAVLAPQPGVAQVPALVDRLCEAGMPVELSVELSGEATGGTPPALPPGIDLAAFRVVQEALTNVMKHAGPTRTTVRLGYRPRDLLITVSDDGPPPDAVTVTAAGSRAGPGGRGLIGLRERIAVYGGELDAGPRPGGGWRLAARIPLDPAAADLPGPQAFQGAWR
jgi:signal transduction histidine kinase